MSGVIVRWDIGVEGAVGPRKMLPDMPKVPRGALLVIGGRAPVWLYGKAIVAAERTNAGGIAIHDPELGAVVVETRSPMWWVGDIVDVDRWKEAA